MFAVVSDTLRSDGVGYVMGCDPIGRGWRGGGARELMPVIKDFHLEVGNELFFVDNKLSVPDGLIQGEDV